MERQSPTENSQKNPRACLPGAVLLLLLLAVGAALFQLEAVLPGHPAGEALCAGEYTLTSEKGICLALIFDKTGGRRCLFLLENTDSSARLCLSEGDRLLLLAGDINGPDDRSGKERLAGNF